MSTKKQPRSKRWLAFTFAILTLVLTAWSIGVIGGTGGTGSIASAAMSTMPTQISTQPQPVDTERAGDQAVPERPRGILDQINDQFMDPERRNVWDARRKSEPHSKGQPNPPCGLEWRVVPSPNTGTQGNLINDIDAISPNDIWATGVYYNDLSYHYRTLAMHWNGVGWNSVPTPNPGTGNNELVSIAAVSSTEVWAVGGYYNTANPYRTFVLRWNGSAWTQVPSPNLGNGDNVLMSVDARPSGEVWAVGYYIDGSIRHTMVQRWNGTVWDVVPGADFGSTWNTLYGVDVVSPNDIWAVGAYSNTQIDSRTLTEHWDGTSWTVVPSPNVVTGTNAFASVDAVSAGSIWAAGLYIDNMGDSHALTMHWDGSSWTVIPTPSPGPGETVLYFNGLSAVSESEVWASGFYYDTPSSNQTMVLRWNGTVWSLQTTVNPGTNRNTTIGIEAVSSLNVWVGGAYSDNDTNSYSLIEHYNDPCITPTPTPTACPVQFTDVPLGSTFYDYVRCLACRNIVSGYTTSPPCTTGTPCFMPGNDVTRGQMAKFVSNAANFTDNIPPSQQTFTDVPYGSTFWLFVERAAVHNVISGYTTSPPCTNDTPCFMPGAKVNRQQTAKFVSQAANYQDPIPPGQQTFTDAPPMTTFWIYIERVVLHGVVSGYTDPARCPTGAPCFKPSDNVTRGQTAKFISNTFFPNCQTPAQ